jgi:hypothetical protein
MQIIENHYFIEYSLFIILISFYICKRMLKYLLKIFNIILQNIQNQFFKSQTSTPSRSVKRDV